MLKAMTAKRLSHRILTTKRLYAALLACLALTAILFVRTAWPQPSATGSPGVSQSSEKEDESKEAPDKKDAGELSWEMPGRVSIYDLQFGPATLKEGEWKFLGNSRTFNAGKFGDRLTLMVRFSYTASGAETPLKFVIRLPGSRQYEETVSLSSRRGQYSYHFTVHRPEDFLGSGSVYLYYGFSIVDVLDFSIMPGS
jgi:hypothetical protein